MKRPTHLEMAGWGLLTLLGAGVLTFKTELGIGYPAFVIGLSIAAGRATQSVKIGSITFVYLCASTLFILSITAGLFWIDYRPARPVTVNMIPAIYGMRNPGPREVRVTLYISSVWCSLVCAMTTRFGLNREGMTWGTVRAVVVFALTMALHLTVVKDRDHSETLEDAAVALYSLMPVYAGYFVALFWDVVRAKNAGD